jgi:maleate cis-trans isomerase
MLPASCTVFEQDFIKITAGFPGVIGCASRMLIKSTDADGLRDMNIHIDKCAEELATIDPDLVIYMCTSGSFLEGNEWEQEIRERIQRISKAPIVTSTSQSVLEALRTQKMSKVAMWTPYDQYVTECEVKWLESNDITVVDYQYGDIFDNLDRGAQTPERTFFCLRRLDHSKADGIFQSCGNIRGIEVLDQLEEDINKPAVNSSQATTWFALRSLGITAKITGFGSLLERH